MIVDVTNEYPLLTNNTRFKYIYCLDIDQSENIAEIIREEMEAFKEILIQSDHPVILISIFKPGVTIHQDQYTGLFSASLDFVNWVRKEFTDKYVPIILANNSYITSVGKAYQRMMGYKIPTIFLDSKEELHDENILKKLSASFEFKNIYFEERKRLVVAEDITIDLFENVLIDTYYRYLVRINTDIHDEQSMIEIFKMLQTALQELETFTPKILYLEMGVSLLGKPDTTRLILKLSTMFNPKDVSIYVAKSWDIKNFFFRKLVKSKGFKHSIIRVGNYEDVNKVISVLAHLSAKNDITSALYGIEWELLTSKSKK